MQLDDLLSFSQSHLLNLPHLESPSLLCVAFQMPMINNCCDSLACVVGNVSPMGAFAI